MMRLSATSLRAAVLGGLASLALLSTPAWALFEDNEARRALLDLRQRVEQQRAQQAEEIRRLQEENAQLRRSILELQRQIETMGGDVARLRGQDEAMARELADTQRRQQDMATGVEERLRKFEPTQVSVDGREFVADPAEQQAFEAALATFRKGDFVAAQAAFGDFLKRYPQSGYRATALFWLGNAQYANRDYRGAIGNFRALLAQSPDHPRAPEAVLSIANCQIELKDSAGARRTLGDLVKAYPESEAAVAARDRLARLR